MKGSHEFRMGSEAPHEHPLRFYRAILAVSGTGYALWWFAVHFLLPQAFNPVGSRVAAVALCFAALAGSYLSRFVARHIGAAFQLCLWAVTAHYFYLFYWNQADINWVVGTYITVVAGLACLRKEAEFLGYGGWVLLLSLALCVSNQLLLNTIFLPGIVTILAFGYVGLRSRLRLLDRSRETSRGFENLFNAVSEGVVVHENGIVIDANDACAAIFGYRRDEVTGLRVIDVVAPESRATVAEKIATLSEDRYEVLGLKKDKSTVWIEIRGKSHVVNGKTVRLSAISDISERKKAEQDRIRYEASQHALRMREEFLSIASHELKTPLTTIKLQTQMALRSVKRGDLSVLEPEKAERLFEQTDRQTRRLSRLVEEMLDVSRITSGKLAIELEDFDLGELARDVVASFEGPFSLSAQGSFPIRADRFRIEQVLANLLSNALKYGNASAVQVTVEATPQGLRLAVEDRGIGIAPEDHERIFHRFERAASPRHSSGLGLGLYISKHIVDAHRGRIEVASALGKGARFTVVLPGATP